MRQRYPIYGTNGVNREVWIGAGDALVLNSLGKEFLERQAQGVVHIYCDYHQVVELQRNRVKIAVKWVSLDTHERGVWLIYMYGSDMERVIHND